MSLTPRSQTCTPPSQNQKCCKILLAPNGTIRKNLIKKLVETGYYNELFYRFKRVNTDEDIGNEMNYNDCQILQMFNNITPQEMNELYEELFFCDKLKIKEIPLNL